MGFEFIINPYMVRALYRRLLIAGYTREEASNLIANMMGLGPSKTGWTTRELIHLLYEEHRDKTNPS